MSIASDNFGNCLQDSDWEEVYEQSNDNIHHNILFSSPLSLNSKLTEENLDAMAKVFNEV